MSSSYQNIIALVFASIVVLSMWYFDKETKNLHANIKIIQNMLKVVISNQQQQLNLHQNDIDPHNFQEEQRQYIPYDVTNNEITDDETEHNIEPENVEIEQSDEQLGTIEEEDEDVIQLPSTEEEIEKPKKKRTYKKKNVIYV